MLSNIADICMTLSFSLMLVARMASRLVMQEGRELTATYTDMGMVGIGGKLGESKARKCGDGCACEKARTLRIGLGLIRWWCGGWCGC